MKHGRKDYESIQDMRDLNDEGVIPEDEPVFLLRAQDKTAAETVAFWANLQKDEEILGSALKQVRAMELWSNQKSADLPKG